MARYTHPFIRPGVYDLGEGRQHSFSREHLGVVAGNTAALIEAGYRIPVLLEHSVPGSTVGGPRRSTAEREGESANDGTVGWLVGINQQEDGSLQYELELTDSTAQDDIERGKMAHTSPEVRAEYLDSEGKTWGPLIAHVALTNRPRYEGQPPLRRPDDPITTNPQGSQEGNPTMQDPPVSSPAAVNVPQSMNDVTNMSNSDAVTSLADPANVEERDPTDSKNPPDEEPLIESPETDVASPEFFDRPVAEAALGRDEFEAVSAPTIVVVPQGRAYREALLDRIQQSRHIPRGLRDRLSSVVGAVQLSRDGEEEPTLRLSDAVTLIEEALPEQATLDPAQLSRANHPRGETFFTGEAGTLSDEEADEIARDQLAATGFTASSATK